MCVSVSVCECESVSVCVCVCAWPKFSMWFLSNQVSVINYMWVW